MVLGGPALYLLGESVFQWRMTGKANTGCLSVATVTALLLAFAIWDLRAPASYGRLRLGTRREIFPTPPPRTLRADRQVVGAVSYPKEM